MGEHVPPMRELSSLSAWRLSLWLILIGGALCAIVYAGLMPASLTAWLASRSEIAAGFYDAKLGRADALIVVFGTLLLGPVALLITLVFLVFATGVLGGFVLPVVRWLALPDWFATILVLLTVVLAAYTGRAMWLPPSLWFLGLVARACRVVFA